MNFSFALSAILSIIPFPLLALLYNLVPEQVPLFVDLAGKPTVMTSKSFLSVFRLPTMGLMIQVICVAMFFVNLRDEQENKTNRVLWLAISLIGAVKMSFTSMEVLIYRNVGWLFAFRIIVWVTVILGVGLLSSSVFTVYKQQRSEFLKEYQKAISKWQYIIISIALAVYLMMVFITKII